MSYLLRQSLRSCRTAPLFTRQAALRFSTSSRWREQQTASQRVDYESKYAEKLRKRAEAEGVTVEQLRERIKEQEKAKRLEKLSTQPAQAPTLQTASGSQPQAAAPSSSASAAAQQARKDSSPVKPLSSIINVDKILEAPHTSEQISLLWRAYHASRSGGTGRGYLCASVPVDAYEKMMGVASKYPSFVIPVPREATDAELQEGENRQAYEFYFMEWGFHGAPLEPRSATDLFAKPKPSSNPQTSTVLYTPLQEYKMRNSFATPYLVLTFYTDLAQSHGVVLLRGEITPSTTSAGLASGGDGRYMLNQQDAQLLAVGAQKFYLWNEGSGEREALLKTFHENPGSFKWEDLLKHAELSA